MPKLLKAFGRGKKKSEDSTSVASGTSNASKRSFRSFRSSKSKQSQSFVEENRSGLQICGYVVLKEASLPKLHKHAWKGNLTKVKEDVKKRTIELQGVDNKGRTALHLAAAMGHNEIVQYLVSMGAKIEARDTQMRTPLLKAADTGHLECLKTLLAQGADPDASDVSGLTSLHVSVHRREVEMVKELINVETTVDVPNNNGSYPIHLAALQGNSDMVKVLASRGADLNPTDNEGKTPLILAAQNGHTNVVKAMLELNAAPNMKAQGMTALEYATRNGHQECAKVLQDNKKKQNPFTIGGLSQNSNLTGSFGYGGVAYETAVYGGGELEEESLSKASSGSHDDWEGSEEEEDSSPRVADNKINLSGAMNRPPLTPSTHKEEINLSGAMNRPPLTQTTHKEAVSLKTPVSSTARPPTADQLGVDLTPGYESPSGDEGEQDHTALSGGERVQPQLTPSSTQLPSTTIQKRPSMTDPPPLRPITPSISTPQHPATQGQATKHIDSDFDTDTEEEVQPEGGVVSTPPKEQDRFGASLLVGAGVSSHRQPHHLSPPPKQPPPVITETTDGGDRGAGLKGSILPPRAEDNGKPNDNSDFDSTDDEQGDLQVNGQNAQKYFQRDSEESEAEESGKTPAQPLPPVTNTPAQPLPPVTNTPAQSLPPTTKKQDLVTELFGVTPGGVEDTDSNFDSDSNLDLPDGEGYIPSMTQVDSEPKRGSSSVVLTRGSLDKSPVHSVKEKMLSQDQQPASPTDILSPSSQAQTVSVTSLTTAPITPLTTAPITPLTTAPITPLTTAPITPLTTAPNMTPFNMMGTPDEHITVKSSKSLDEVPPMEPLDASHTAREKMEKEAYTRYQFKQNELSDVLQKRRDQVDGKSEESEVGSDWDSENDEEDEIGGALVGLDGGGVIDTYPPGSKKTATSGSSKQTSKGKVDYFSMIKSDGEDDSDDGELTGLKKSTRTPQLTSPRNESRVRQIMAGYVSPPPSSHQEDGNGDKNGKENETQDLNGNGDQNVRGNETQNSNGNGDQNVRGNETQNSNGNGDQNVRGNETQNSNGNGDQNADDSWDSNEDEEESEWEIEQRASKQSVHPTQDKGVVPPMPSASTLPGLTTSLPTDLHRPSLPPLQQGRSPSPLEPLKQGRSPSPLEPLKQGRSPSPLELLQQGRSPSPLEPLQQGRSPSPLEPLQHVKEPSLSKEDSKDSPHTAREKMEKEAYTRYQFKQNELLNVLQKRRDQVDGKSEVGSDSTRPTGSAQQTVPSASTKNHSRVEKKSSEGDNPAIKNSKLSAVKQTPDNQLSVKPGVLSLPTSRPVSAPSEKKTGNKVRDIVMSSLTPNQPSSPLGQPAPTEPPLTETVLADTPPKKVAPADTPPTKVIPEDTPPKKVAPTDTPPTKVIPEDTPPKKVVPPDTPPKQLSPVDPDHKQLHPVQSTHTDTPLTVLTPSEHISSTGDFSDVDQPEGETPHSPPLVHDSSKISSVKDKDESFVEDLKGIPLKSSLNVTSSMQYMIPTATSENSSPELSEDDLSESVEIPFDDHEENEENVGGQSGSKIVGMTTTPDPQSRPHSQISIRGYQMSPVTMHETSQLRESLRETRKQLEAVTTERNDLDSKRKKQDEEISQIKKTNRVLTVAKSEVERQKSDLELEIRMLKHKLELETEDKKSLDATISELRAKIRSQEEEMSSERQNKYTLELRRKEFEMEQHTLKATNQQLQARLAELMEEVRAERDARRTAEQNSASYVKDFKSLKEQVRDATDEKRKAVSQLESTETSHRSTVDRLAQLQKENQELQAQLLGEKRKYEESLDSVERELDSVKDRLSEKTDLLAVSENHSVDLKRQYEANLSEVKTKAEMLSATCDREAANRNKLEQEVTSLMNKLEYSHSRVEELTRRNIEMEKSGHSSKADWIYEKSKYEKELEMSRERSETLCERVEVLEQKLASSVAEVKSLHDVLSEKSNTITVLQHDLDQRAALLTAAEEKIGSLNECVNTTVSSLQADFSRTKKDLEKKLSELRIQLGERELDIRELTKEREELLFRMEGIDKMGGAESIRAHINGLMDAEKEKMRKISELQVQSEAKVQQERQRNAELLSEVASLRTKLKSSRAKLKDSEGKLSGVVHMKADYERIQNSLKSDLYSLKERLSDAEGQLKKESSVRVEAEMLNKSLQKEVHHLNKKLSASAASRLDQEKEWQKLERLNRKITEELKSYKEHVASNFVEKSEALALKKHIEEKAHNELKKKLQEVNDHLQQQALNQQDLDQMRLASEAEWKERYTQDTTHLKMQVSQLQSALEDSRLVSDKCSTELNKFKTLYESELSKTQRLSSRLERAKENAAASRTKLLLERNRERLLAETTLSNATKLDHSHMTPHASHLTEPVAPTSARNNSTMQSEDDALLSSVRRTLDSSLAKHLDPGLTPILKWKSEGPSEQSFLKPSDLTRRTGDDAHLQSIIRGYKLH